MNVNNIDAISLVEENIKNMPMSKWAQIKKKAIDEIFAEEAEGKEKEMFRREVNSNYSSKVRMQEKPVILEEKNNNHYHKQESQFFVTDEAVNKKEERKYKCDGVLINGNYYTNEQLLKLNLSEKENNNIQNKFQKKTQTGYLVKGYFYTPEEFYLMIDKGICKEIDGQKTNRTVETPVEFQEMYIWKDNYYTSEEIDHLIEKNIITLDEVNKGFEKGVKIIPKNKQIKKGEDISMIALESRERTFEDARKQKYMYDRKRRREHEANIANIELSEKIALQKLQDKRNKGCML